MKPDGILLLDKQPGMTSFDCIRDLKRHWKRTDIGHGGTLDKFASGLLPIFVGEGLKLARFFLESYPGLPTYWKTYTGTIELGVATETGDPEGAISGTRPLPENFVGLASVEAVQSAMNQFIGATYDQLPPKYSAKKIAGARASDLMREGKDPELTAVSVTIRAFRCASVEGSRVHFETECSKGTYVRVLAQDLAEKLGTVAHLTSLRRTCIGGFRVEHAFSLAQVREQEIERLIPGLEPSLSFLARFNLLPEEVTQLKVGRTDSIATRLSNSGLAAGVYYAASDKGPEALFELDQAKQAKFIRAFVR